MDALWGGEFIVVKVSACAQRCLGVDPMVVVAREKSVPLGIMT